MFESQGFNKKPWQAMPVLVRVFQLWSFWVHVDKAYGVAGLESVVGLLDLAPPVVRNVLRRPPEAVLAFKVGLAELVPPALGHALHPKWDGPVHGRVIDTAKAKLLGRPPTGFDGRRACGVTHPKKRC